MLRAGEVGRPHGLDGSFYVERPVPELLNAGTGARVGNREAHIVRRAGTDRRPIVRIEGCEDRASAEALGGEFVLVQRALAPELGQDQWWAEDLEGCSVRDAAGRLGTVRRLLALPSCEVLEVELERGGELMIPMVKDAIRAVDLEQGVIDVDSEFLLGD